MKRLSRNEMKQIMGGDDCGAGGGCKDACTKGMTCSVNGGQTGECKNYDRCNGTDGNEYLVLYCTAKP